MANWIVIEGDNGTGKDTLAEQVKTLGFDIVTYAKEVKSAEMGARALYGEDRLFSFLEYNRLCGSIASSSNYPSLLIRYWVSTMAAAYADQLWTWDKVNEQVIRCINQFPVPDLIIQIKCELSTRRNRVAIRGASDDNMCMERDKNYAWALDEMRKHFPSWETVDTTSLSPSQVFQVVKGILKERGL
jgi:deoxyadenosine/deoxycytidine kinase